MSSQDGRLGTSRNSEPPGCDTGRLYRAAPLNLLERAGAVKPGKDDGPLRFPLLRR